MQCIVASAGRINQWEVIHASVAFNLNSLKGLDAMDLRSSALARLFAGLLSAAAED